MSLTDKQKIEFFDSVDSFAFYPKGSNPIEDEHAREFKVTVQRDEDGHWMIQTAGPMLWQKQDQQWYYYSMPDVRGNNRKFTKFTLEEALEIAPALPDKRYVNGFTYQGWIEFLKNRTQ